MGSLLSRSFTWGHNETLDQGFGPWAALIESAAVLVVEAPISAWLLPSLREVGMDASLVANTLSFGAGRLW